MCYYVNSQQINTKANKHKKLYIITGHVYSLTCMDEGYTVFFLFIQKIFLFISDKYFNELKKSGGALFSQKILCTAYFYDPPEMDTIHRSIKNITNLNRNIEFINYLQLLFEFNN